MPTTYLTIETNNTAATTMASPYWWPHSTQIISHGTGSYQTSINWTPVGIYNNTAATSAQIYQYPHIYQTTGSSASVYDWTVYQNGQIYDSSGVRAESAEQRERRLRVSRRAKLTRERAARKGRKLLLSLLADSQKREYAATRTFKVTAANGIPFRLRKGRTAERLTPLGELVASYCIHLPGSYCDEDTLIALMFMLETDPAQFEKTANVTVHRYNYYAPMDEQTVAVPALRAA